MNGMHSCSSGNAFVVLPNKLIQPVLKQWYDMKGGCWCIERYTNKNDKQKDEKRNYRFPNKPFLNIQINLESTKIQKKTFEEQSDFIDSHFALKRLKQTTK